MVSVFIRMSPFSIYELDPFSRNLAWTSCQLRPLRRHTFLFNTAGKSNTEDRATC